MWVVVWIYIYGPSTIKGRHESIHTHRVGLHELHHPRHVPHARHPPTTAPHRAERARRPATHPHPHARHATGGDTRSARRRGQGRHGRVELGLGAVVVMCGGIGTEGVRVIQLFCMAWAVDRQKQIQLDPF